MTFEYFNTKFHRDESKSSLLLFDIICSVDNFYPWKDIVGKKVSKLRSIAELRAFYGMIKLLTFQWLSVPEPGGHKEMSSILANQ